MRYTRYHVAVIGAGAMGLAAAYLLNKEGFQVTVYEKNKSAGGQSQSVTLKNGNKADMFYHYFCKSDKAVFNLLEELNLKHKLHFERVRTGILRQREMNDVIFEDLNGVLDTLALKDVSATAKFRFLWHLFLIRFKGLNLKNDLATAKDVYQKMEGKEAYSFFWDYLLSKKFFKDADKISALFLDCRIKRVMASTSLRGTYYGFYEGGTGAMLNDIIEILKNRGVEFRFNTEVISINEEQIKFRNRYNDKIASEYTENIISTIPLHYLIPIVKNLTQKDLDIFCSTENYGCICSMFVLKKPFSDTFWTNVNRRDWDTNGIVDFSSVKTIKGNIVYIPFYMPHNHTNWHKTDRDMLYLCENMLREYLDEDNEIIEKHIYRYEYAQPVFTTDFFNRIKSVKTSIKGFYCADTCYAYPNDRCVDECIKTAERLVKELIRDDEIKALRRKR